MLILPIIGAFEENVNLKKRFFGAAEKDAGRANDEAAGRRAAASVGKGRFVNETFGGRARRKRRAIFSLQKLENLAIIAGLTRKFDAPFGRRVEVSGVNSDDVVVCVSGRNGDAVSDETVFRRDRVDARPIFDEPGGGAPESEEFFEGARRRTGEGRRAGIEGRACDRRREFRFRKAVGERRALEVGEIGRRKIAFVAERRAGRGDRDVVKIVSTGAIGASSDGETLGASEIGGRGDERFRVRRGSRGGGGRWEETERPKRTGFRRRVRRRGRRAFERSDEAPGVDDNFGNGKSDKSEK